MKIDALASSSFSLDWLQQYDVLELMGLDGKVPKRALSRTRSLDYLRTQKNNALLLRHLMQRVGAVHHKEDMLLMLPRNNMERLLNLLDKDVLLFGLTFFPKNVLLGIMSKLPKAALLKLFLQRFPVHKFLALFSTPILWHMFKHPKIQMPQLLNALCHLPENKLQLLFKTLTGKDGDFMQKPELVKSMAGFKKEQLLGAFKKLDKKSMITLLTALARQEPEILMAIPQHCMIGVLTTFTKGAIITLMSGLNNDVLRVIDSCLSDKQLATTLSFLSNDLFTNTMISNFPETVVDYIALESAQGAA